MINAYRLRVLKELIEVRTMAWYRQWMVEELTMVKNTPAWNFAAIHAFADFYSGQPGNYRDCLDRDRLTRGLWLDQERLLR